MQDRSFSKTIHYKQALANSYQIESYMGKKSMIRKFLKIKQNVINKDH